MSASLYIPFFFDRTLTEPEARCFKFPIPLSCPNSPPHPVLGYRHMYHGQLLCVHTKHAQQALLATEPSPEPKKHYPALSTFTVC